MHTSLIAPINLCFVVNCVTLLLFIGNSESDYSEGDDGGDFPAHAYRQSDPGSLAQQSGPGSGSTVQHSRRSFTQQSGSESTQQSGPGSTVQQSGSGSTQQSSPASTVQQSGSGSTQQSSPASTVQQSGLGSTVQHSRRSFTQQSGSGSTQLSGSMQQSGLESTVQMSESGCAELTAGSKSSGSLGKCI